MARYRNKLVYDASTGEIRDDRNYMSMLEDFWLPSREVVEVQILLHYLADKILEKYLTLNTLEANYIVH